MPRCRRSKLFRRETGRNQQSGYPAPKPRWPLATTILFLEGKRMESGTALPKSHALNAAQHWPETCRQINKRCSYTSSWTEFFESTSHLGIRQLNCVRATEKC